MAKEMVRWKPWEPLKELQRMRREMDRLWESFFETKPARRQEEMSEWVPSIDLSETKESYIVKAEIPGMEAKDIDITLQDDLLTIRGEKKQEKEEKDENYHFVERSYGSFTRSIRLPQEVKGDKIKASYKDGVLKITLPKSEEAKKKETKIKVE
jgi:HSP20 family protein